MDLEYLTKDNLEDNVDLDFKALDFFVVSIEADDKIQRFIVAAQSDVDACHYIKKETGYIASPERDVIGPLQVC